MWVPVQGQGLFHGDQPRHLGPGLEEGLPHVNCVLHTPLCQQCIAVVKTYHSDSQLLAYLASRPLVDCHSENRCPSLPQLYGTTSQVVTIVL